MVFSMDRYGSTLAFSLKKPRSRLGQKRPSWGYLLFEPGETYESSSQPLHQNETSSVQNVDTPINGFRRELLQSKHAPIGPDCSRTLDDVSEREGTALLKVFHKRKGNTPEKIHRCSENFPAFKKQNNENPSKGSQLLQYEERIYGHGDRFISKIGPSSTRCNGRIVLGHSFDDDLYSGHKDDVHEDTRGKATKHGPEPHPKGKPGLKFLGNRTFKRPSLKLNCMQQHVNGAMRFREHASRDSYSLLEAKRHGHFQVLQNTLEDDEGPPSLRGDSLEMDVDGESNPQSSPKVVWKNSRYGHSQTFDPVDLPVPSVRKSSRVPKRRILDGDDVEVVRRSRKMELELVVDYDGGNAPSEATDAAGEDQILSETECLKGPFLTASEQLEPDLDEKEPPLTARQHAVKASKEGREAELGCNPGMCDEQLPGLPRKQKETLIEAEQAIKKEEAARRRKQQIERNAKEIQALTIQKILGQESSRKKREEKLQKQRQEIEEEKRAASMAPAVNSIRWVMGPSGNVVSFSEDVELSKIFSGPCSYPGKREKCVGPSCNNAYKYRDSKTLLPLCSLKCYKAVQRVPPSTSSAY